jgi:predicted RNase H-like HicB family nuclease
MDQDYQIITWFSQEDFAFIAQISQVPQCIAQGQTEEEALFNLQLLIAKNEWLAANLTLKQMGQK